jgi:flagellin FlaB
MRFFKDEKAFTGLEAAIVLIAFVVVAAVFSYVMLGAGFFTTQKSQEVVHTGVQQASSSIELSGDIIGEGNTTADRLEKVRLFVQLTAGGNPVDISKTLITVTTDDAHHSFTLGSVANATNFMVANKYGGDTDNLLEKFEKFEIVVNVTKEALGASTDLTANEKFQLEIKPPQGASVTVVRTVPASIDAIMTLV